MTLDKGRLLVKQLFNQIQNSISLLDRQNWMSTQKLLKRISKFSGYFIQHIFYI